MTVISRLSVDLQRRFGRQRLRKFFLGSIPFLFFIIIWHANTVFEWLPPVFVPAIGEVWDAIFFLQEDCPGFVPLIKLDNDCMMTTHILSSLGRVILATVIGLPAGIALGVVAGMSRPLSKFLEPVGVFANSISGIAWIPLAIVWFGVGWVTTLFIMLNTIFWLMFFNSMLGVRSIAKVYEDSILFRSTLDYGGKYRIPIKGNKIDGYWRYVGRKMWDHTRQRVVMERVK